jgi:hypothetical protein
MLGAFYFSNFVTGCPMLGCSTLYNPPGGGCIDGGWFVPRNTFYPDPGSIVNRANMYGDNQTYPAGVVWPRFALPTTIPVDKFVPPPTTSIPHYVESFSYCYPGCTGPLVDCITCSATEPITYPLCTSPSYARVAQKTESNQPLILSPVPASDLLKVSKMKDATDLEIINLFGNIVYYKRYSSEEVIIDIQNLRPGTYFLRANNTTYYKFIKL